jgi:exosome complex RNA-binding protein Rrp4
LSSQDAALLLSAVILPDGMQRIRGYEDQLQMRSFFQENDVISAEVQNIMVRGISGSLPVFLSLPTLLKESREWCLI